VPRSEGCNPSSCDHSLCVKIARVPLASAPFNRFSHTPYPLARLRVARLPVRWSVMMALRTGGSPPHPSSSHQPTSLQGIYFRASEPLLVLRASGVQIRCFYSWWKLTPLFQGALHHHRGLFSAHPLSAVLQYNFIMLFTFIDLLKGSPLFIIILGVYLQET
jgi:hypothetical protein